MPFYVMDPPPCESTMTIMSHYDIFVLFLLAPPDPYYFPPNLLSPNWHASCGISSISVYPPFPLWLTSLHTLFQHLFLMSSDMKMRSRKKIDIATLMLVTAR